MTTIDNTHKAKHNPGAGFAFPSHAGTTQHTGVTIRAYMATKIFSHVAKLSGGPDDLEKIVNFSILAADTLIEKLYPAPVTAKLAVAQAERGVCEHMEVMFNSQNGTYQCVKCRQGVDPAVVHQREKKR